MRDRIDWENLQPLPRRITSGGATREDLAARKFHAHKAKHKGRNHISNQKRRCITQAAAKNTKLRNGAKISRFRDLKNRIASYWRGEIDEHPQPLP